MHTIKITYFETGNEPQEQNVEVNQQTAYLARQLIEIGCVFEVEKMRTGSKYISCSINGIAVDNFVAFDDEMFENMFPSLVKKAYEARIGAIPNNSAEISNCVYVSSKVYQKQADAILSFINNDLIPDGIGSFSRSRLSKFKFFVAGGAVTSVFTKKEINDYDLYFYNEEDFLTFVENICRRHASKVMETDRAITWNRGGVMFQTIKLYGTPEHVFRKYDFTICMGALIVRLSENADEEYDEFCFDNRFFTDIASRSLIVNTKTDFPINTLFRINKYKERGYKINTVEMLKLGFAISELNIRSLSQIKNQLSGLSSDVMQSVTKILEERIRIGGDIITQSPSDFLAELLKDIDPTNGSRVVTSADRRRRRVATRAPRLGTGGRHF